MTHGSLFSGIGGFDLAAQWMGWTNVFHCEKDPFCQRILRHHFPGSESYDDIKQLDATQFRGRVSLISGGFPCQPFSAAGKRKGTSDDRHLWPEMLRVISEIRPRWVVAENVRGLTNWEGGLQFESCCIDLENEGYQVFPTILGACSVNAPHGRDRIWVIATNADGSDTRSKQGANAKAQREIRGNEEGDVLGALRGNGTASDTCNKRLEGSQKEGDEGADEREQQEGAVISGFASSRWSQFPTVAPICGGDDGLPTKLDGITVPKWKRESIKAYGNAIVPQVALEIFQTIQSHEESR